MLLWDSELHWRVSQSVKSRSPRSVLDHSHADFSGRARHPSVCFPSSITRFYFQDLNILRFFSRPARLCRYGNRRHFTLLCLFFSPWLWKHFNYCQIYLLSADLFTWFSFNWVSFYIKILLIVAWGSSSSTASGPSCSRLLRCCPMNWRVVHLAAFDFPSIISSRAPSGQLVMWPDDQHWFSENGFIKTEYVCACMCSSLRCAVPKACSFDKSYFWV